MFIASELLLFFFEVNFEDMEKIKLNDSEIRRSVEDGMSVQIKTSPHQRQFQAKVYRVQVKSDHYNTYIIISV